MNSEIQKAIEVLKSGGNILCPTDTVWGLSADATNFEAVQAIFELKKRPKNKSMIVLVSSIEMLENYVEKVPDFVLDFLKSVSNPSSIIYPKGKNLASNVLAENGSIAIRIVLDGFAHDLITQFEKAIISTSANFSGETAPRSFENIQEELKDKIDYCVDRKEGHSNISVPSSIFLIEKESLNKLR